MSVPLSTTTLKVETVTYPSGRSEPPAYAEIGRRRGGVSSPSGRDQQGSQEVVDAIVLMDPIAMTKDSRITDLTTGDVWDAVWVRKRVGLGLDHMTVGVRRATGLGEG